MEGHHMKNSANRGFKFSVMVMIWRVRQKITPNWLKFWFQSIPPVDVLVHTVGGLFFISIAILGGSDLLKWLLEYLFDIDGRWTQNFIIALLVPVSFLLYCTIGDTQFALKYPKK